MNRVRISTMAALVGGASLLTACYYALELSVQNTCGQPIAFGFHYDDDTTWDLVEAGDEFTLAVDGMSTISITVLAEDAERRADPVELRLGDLPDTTEVEWTDQVTLDLAGQNLCP